MDRTPRGSIPPYAFRAVATLAPVAFTREAPETTSGDVPDPVPDPVARAKCELAATCPVCTIDMLPEHAHYKCPRCGYRDSCCF